MKTLTKPQPHRPITALLPFVEFVAGFDAYFDRKGPGIGLMRSAGWIQACYAERAELARRDDERGEQQPWMY